VAAAPDGWVSTLITTPIERIASMSKDPTQPARHLIVLWVILAALLVAVLGVVVYKAWPLLYPQVMALAPLDPECRLRQAPCTATFAEGGAVTLAIEPLGIPVVAPLAFRVDLAGLQALGVELDFAGADMNMGYNRVAMEPMGDGRYQGKGMLPVCVRDHMTWEAKVLVQTRAGLMVAPFRFETSRTGQGLP
jgi:hypothetical protein